MVSVRLSSTYKLFLPDGFCHPPGFRWAFARSTFTSGEYDGSCILVTSHPDLILPTDDGHPVKRVNYAIEVTHDKQDRNKEGNPEEAVWFTC